MIKTIENYIIQEKLFRREDKIIVGLSGGADSVVLLSVLGKLGYECLAAHCNFHLRGEESDRDEKFAAQRAQTLKIPFLKQDFNTLAVAKEQGISIEMAARDLRYQWFEELREKHQAIAIAVAHHRDDSIETMLLNLIRGTGLAGLTGIKPKSGKVVRPLLCISKAAVLEYAEKEKLPFVIDSSNLQDEFTRNKIRRQLQPLLRSLNPGLDSSLLRTMEHLNEVSKIYYSHIQEIKEKVFDHSTQAISIPELLASPSPESVLFELLKEYGFGKDVIRSIYQAVDSQSGKIFYSAEYQLIKDRKNFFLQLRKQNERNFVFYIRENTKTISTPFPMSVRIQNDCPEIIKSKRLAYFDFSKLKFPLTLRKWQQGDRFVPFGMTGSQKLSDYFNNHKFDKHEKENTWLLCSDKDIIWLVGHRTDNRFRIEKNSKKFIILELL